MAIQVRNIMSKPLLTIDISKSARNAAEIMRRTRRDSIIVTKNQKPVGIVTDTDLIKKIVARNLLPSGILVGKIMSAPLVVIDAGSGILDASIKMKKSNIKRLAVLDKNKLVGIVSLSDIARSSPEMIDLLEFKLRSKEMPTEIKEKITSGICDNCGNYSPNLQNKDGQWMCESCREEEE